jgi:hypothetical protein
VTSPSSSDGGLTTECEIESGPLDSVGRAIEKERLAGRLKEILSDSDCLEDDENASLEESADSITKSSTGTFDHTG